MARFFIHVFFLMMLCGACFVARSGDSLELVVNTTDLSKDAQAAEQWMNRQELFVIDTAATGYIERIAAHVGAGDSVVSRLHIRLAKMCAPNAVTYANGLLLMCTGVFAAIDNEDQLALLLAHEIAHLELNHHVRERYVLHQRSVEMVRNGIIGSLFVGSLATAGLEISLQHAMCGFSREMEAEADNGALDRIIRAGYDPATAILLFDNLKACGGDDSAQTDPLLYTHYRLSDRAARGREYLAAQHCSSVPVALYDDEYRNRLGRVRFTNANECITVSDWNLALRSVDAYLGSNPLSASAAAVKGDVFLMRRGQADLDSAMVYLRKAITDDSVLAAAHRDLGYCYLLKGQMDTARACLSRYQSLSPAATDSAFVKFYLRYIDER